jgi:uncharacterized protein (TIGR02099 family)
MTAHPPPLSSRLAGVLLGLLGLALCAACIAYLSVRYVLWPRLDTWRPELVEQVGRQLGVDLTVAALHPGWDGLSPTLALDGLRITGGDGEPRLEVASAYVRVSWRSLMGGSPRLAALRLDGPSVVVERLAPGRFAVAGLELSGEGPSDGRGLDWLLTQGELEIHRASLHFVDRAAGFPPQRLDGITVLLRSTGRRHQASVALGEPGEAIAALSAVAEVYRPPLTRPSEWQRWKGEAHLSIQGLDLARVVRLIAPFAPGLPAPVAAAQGRVDQLLWARFDEGRLLETTVKLQAAAPATQLPQGRLELQSLRAEVRALRQRDGGHSVRIQGLSATDTRGFVVAVDGDAELGLDPASGLRSAWLRLKSFDAAAALAAARGLPLPGGAAQGLAEIELSGDVRDLTVRWSRPDAPPTEARPADRTAEAAGRVESGFELSASFDRLGLVAREAPAGLGRPGFRNLSGSVRASEREGTLTLTGRKAVLDFPGVFAESAVPFERLDGEVAWTLDAARGEHWLQVSVPRLEVANADGDGVVSGTWRSGGKGPGLVDLEARIERAAAARVARYLPLALPPMTREWIERALVSGVAENLVLKVHGDLWDFPFREASGGLFRLTAGIRDASLAYAPDWPRIEHVRGDLVLEGAGLDVRAQAAQIAGVRLSEVRASIAGYHDALLIVEGRGAGPAQDMLRFVDDSPLAAMVSTFTQAIRVAGDARLALKLQLPLADLSATRVAGTVELAGNDVTLDSTLPEFSGVSGQVAFTERGLSLNGLSGLLLGGPIRVEGRSAGEGRMRIDAAGAIDAAGMRRLVDNPLTRRLEGRTDYRATVEVDRRASTLRIESELVGLSSALPAPFAKAAGELWPLRVVSRPLQPSEASARPPGDRIDIRLRDTIAFAVERERDPTSERLLIRRAGFAVDAEPALRESGLSVLLRTPSIDFDAWRAVLSDGDIDRIERSAAAGAAPGITLLPDLVSVVADDVRIGGRDLHEVVFGASRVAGRWRANIASREVQGHFDWLDARPGEQIGTLVARFNRLELPRSREVEVESALSTSPTRLPALDVAAEELVLGGVSVGALTLAATNGGSPARPVWTLDRLVVANPAARLEASGRWSFPAAGAAAPPGAPRAGGDPRSTELDFKLEVRDAGALLARFGQRGAMRGGSGSLGGAIHWHGSPLALDHPSLDGKIRLELGAGEFLKIDPGIAKLIGVLNMQSLPKRLAGDFRDLFAEGFVFDTVSGDVRIDNGIARTDELLIRGVQAQVRIRGEADIQRETQRLQVEVVPEFNAGLASLAFGAMVNPVIGLGSFAAQYVLRKPLQEVLAYEVDVTGSWSDPAVSERNRRLAPRAPAGTGTPAAPTQ